MGPAAAALMQEDLWSRSHVAAYLLPEVTLSVRQVAFTINTTLISGTFLPPKYTFQAFPPCYL